MNDKSKNKSFLDTSILRPLLLGTIQYKNFLSSKIDSNSSYINNYVRMEFKRSYIIAIIDFYFVLNLPTIYSIADALTFWSNRFKASEQKAVLTLVSQLVQTHHLETNKKKSKEHAITSLGYYIKRIMTILDSSFKNTGNDSTRCQRDTIKLSIDNQNIAMSFKKYFEEFNDVKHCRSKCAIEKFIFEKWKKKISLFIEHSKTLKKDKSSSGFIKIAENFDKILIAGPNSCSCRMCGNIGDGVISLESPNEMTIEHIDNSFDHLCKLLKKNHTKYRSEISFHNNSLTQTSS